MCESKFLAMMYCEQEGLFKYNLGNAVRDCMSVLVWYDMNISNLNLNFSFMFDNVQSAIKRHEY